MGRLTRGYFDMRTQKSREVPSGLGLKIATEDSYDYQSAIVAQTTKTRPRAIAMSNFKQH